MFNVKTQAELVAQVAKASKGPVVVVYIGGGACDFAAIKANPDVHAIIVAGYPSQEGGTAIAQTIFGDNNPAGRKLRPVDLTVCASRCALSL